MSSPGPSGFAKEDVISLKRLTKHCVDACVRGCREIRTVAKRNRMDESNNEKIEHTFKDENDARSALTEADVNAQSVIIGALRNSYGEQLNIVGEEDGDANAKPREDEKPLREDCFEFLKMNEVEDVDVKVGDLVIFCDPVDGTREFIEERYHNCQCLIGIAHKGKAVVGVVGIPFPKGRITKESDVEACAVVYGMCYEKNKEEIETVRVLETCNEDLLGGAAAAAATSSALAESTVSTKTEQQLKKQRVSSDSFILTTGDSKSKALRAAVEKITECINEEDGYPSAPERLITGGAGNKILRVSTGISPSTCSQQTQTPTTMTTSVNDSKQSNPPDCALMHMGTCAWDTAAPEAVLLASGGKITDLFGEPLIYDASNKSEGYVNKRGVLASSKRTFESGLHEKFVQKMKSSQTLLNLFGVANAAADADDGASDGPRA